MNSLFKEYTYLLNYKHSSNPNKKLDKIWDKFEKRKKELLNKEKFSDLLSELSHQDFFEGKIKYKNKFCEISVTNFNTSSDLNAQGEFVLSVGGFY